MRRLLFGCVSCVFLITLFVILHTQTFERIPPNIQLHVMKNNVPNQLHTSFFNPENDIRLSAFDSSGIAAYSVRITNKEGKIITETDEILLKKAETLEAILPKIPDLPDGDEVFYQVVVRDWSNANFFRGNEASITKHFVINKRAPKVQIIAASEQILYGGSALVAFSIQDLELYEKMKESSIDKVIVSNGHDEFEAYPFMNKHNKVVYLALIAWPIKNTFFDGSIRVIDSAMNETRVPIPMATNVNYVRRKLNITMNDSRLQNMVKRLEESVNMPSDLRANIEKFQFFNETILYQNNQKIANFFHIAKQLDIQPYVPRLNVFAPARDSKTSGRFGDEYMYKYHKDSIGLSVRYGIEFIPDQDTRVFGSNDGVVVYNGAIGAYGNLVAINHLLGLTSLYGYLDSLPTLPTHIQSLDQIGRMGHSGFAGTKSLFFAVLVQGHFVNPNEWLQAQWIDTNINQVLDRADNFGITGTNTH